MSAAIVPTDRSTSHALRICAAVYVAAWLVGLVVAPSGPGLDADAVAVQAHVAANAGSLLVQGGLVHGVAGVALIGFVLALTREIRPGQTRIVGIAAGAVSLLQFSVLVVAATSAGGAEVSPEIVAAPMRAIDLLDTVKLTLLALTIAMAAKSLRQTGWLRRLGATLVVLLPVSGFAFVVESELLYTLLYLSLPLLLLWVGSTAFARPTRRHQQPAG